MKGKRYSEEQIFRILQEGDRGEHRQLSQYRHNITRLPCPFCIALDNNSIELKFPTCIPGFAALADASEDSGEGGLRSFANKFSRPSAGLPRKWNQIWHPIPEARQS